MAHFVRDQKKDFGSNNMRYAELIYWPLHNSTLRNDCWCECMGKMLEKMLAQIESDRTK